MRWRADGKRPVVFLDRDGTLNEEIGYIRDVDRLELVAGAGEAVRRLNETGVAAVLVTNQSGAARGYYPESHIEDLNNRLVKLLGGEGARLDAIYYCPHLPEGVVAHLSCRCLCRKPATGMIERAYREHSDLDAGKAYVVGDKATDVELARNCGARAVLVATGYGQDVLEGKYQWRVTPDFVAANIEEAVDWILTDLSMKKE